MTVTAGAPVVDARHLLSGERRRWLVTGSAGFIGSHLLETLLASGQRVTSLDNFATGHRANLEEVRRLVGEAAWSAHDFIEGDVADWNTCVRACEGVDIVLHQAALGSVPRSIANPRETHAANATGFLNLLTAARDARVKRFVYAASSSTYGDDPALPKVERNIGRPLSPYAVTKYLNELYADVFGRCYGIATIGLRYFNVFGPRQDPEGAYAAVIPRWVDAMLSERAVSINGDGETSRDFCYIGNVVRANLLAALAGNPDAVGEVYNVAVGERTSLIALHGMIADLLKRRHPELHVPTPRFEPFRAGDVRHSQADISKARTLLGYAPEFGVRRGLELAMPWYESRSAARGDRRASVVAD